MASTRQCPFCGATVRSDEKVCPGCGAANEGYVEDAPRTIYRPKTIEELKEYCAERGMPRLKMRFFIGENYQQPKAFGIYQDKDQFVVYKNKANGQRAIRYQGPDEAHAVNELFTKLLDECHMRGIYPDGKPQQISNTGELVSRSAGTRSGPKAGGRLRWPDDKKGDSTDKFYNSVGSSSFDWEKFGKVFLILFFIVIIGMMLYSCMSHSNDGYYRDSRDKLYYRYGSSWYTYVDYDSDYSWVRRSGWSKTSSFPENNKEDYYIGREYRSNWGGSDFKDSSYWEQIQADNSSSSSDYDSWDAGDTDWDSDW